MLTLLTTIQHASEILWNKDPSTQVCKGVRKSACSSVGTCDQQQVQTDTESCCLTEAESRSRQLFLQVAILKSFRLLPSDL